MDTKRGEAALAELEAEMAAEKEVNRDREAVARMAFEGPAVFANRFYISRHADVVRISFGDQNSIATEPQFRAAVALSSYDAGQLSEILATFLGNSPRSDGEASEVPGRAT